MKFFNQIGQYLYLVKNEETKEEESDMIRYMHGINRISLIMFLCGLIIVVMRNIMRH